MEILWQSKHNQDKKFDIKYKTKITNAVMVNEFDWFTITGLLMQQ